ncbi:MAG: hypothetical protein QM698_04795 [Micropepsaceae bacterium]
MVRIFVFIALALASLGIAAGARGEVLPRTVIVVTDGLPGGLAARLGVPALNAIGLNAEIHRADTGLPDLGERRDVAGILIWLDEGRIADGAAFLAWVRRATTQNIPIAMMGATPAVEDRFGFFIALGILYSVEDRAYTYDLKPVEKIHGLVEPGRSFGGVWPIADQIRPLEPPVSEAALMLQRGADSFDRTAPLLFTPRAAYAAPGYATWRSADTRDAAWMIDPGLWFARAFRLGVRPVPDAGHINARRIFAPSLAPADAAAANGVMRAASGLGGAQPLDVLLDPPESGQPVETCHTETRTRFFGSAALLDASGRGAYAPVVTLCADDPEAARAAVRAAYAYAAANPLLTADVRLEDVTAGFAAAEIEPDGEHAWRIRNRGALQSVRFDQPGALRVDWTHSEGVLGAARMHDALIASLDPEVDEPLLALTQAAFEPPPFAVLVESRWTVAGLTRDADNVAARVQGYGPGDMVWQVEPRSEWEIRLQPEGAPQMRWRAVVGEDGLISISLPADAAKGAAFSMERQDYAGAGP